MSKFSIPEKKCSRCKESKLVHEFGQVVKNRDGYNASCKECIKKHKKESELDKIRNNTRKTSGVPDRTWFGKI